MSVGWRKFFPRLNNKQIAEEFNAGRVKAESWKDIDVVTGALATSKGLWKTQRCYGTLMRLIVIEKALKEDSLDMGVKSADEIQMTLTA